jgi:hypothetical protein
MVDLRPCGTTLVNPRPALPLPFDNSARVFEPGPRKREHIRKIMG